MHDSMEDKIIFTEKECAKRLGVSFWTLRSLRINGNAPHVLLGSRIYYVYRTIVAWLEQQSEQATQIRTI